MSLLKTRKQNKRNIVWVLRETCGYWKRQTIIYRLFGGQFSPQGSCMSKPTISEEQSLKQKYCKMLMPHSTNRP